MLGRDRIALEDVLQAVLNGGELTDRLGGCDRQTIRALDHFAQRTLLEKSNLTELLFAHLFIACAFQFFGARLADDVGYLLFSELATELLLLRFDGHVPLLRPFRESFE